MAKGQTPSEGWEVGEHDRGGRGNSVSNARPDDSTPLKRKPSDVTMADVKAGRINRAK